MNTRFSLQKDSENGCYICTDTSMYIEVRFHEHQFNDTQEVNIKDNTLPVEVCAKALRELAQWLYDNHRDLVI